MARWEENENVRRGRRPLEARVPVGRREPGGSNGESCRWALPASQPSLHLDIVGFGTGDQFIPNACSPNLRGLANQPRDQRAAMSRPRAPSACSKVNTRAMRAGEQGSSFVFASETPCVHYSKQAPARGPSRRIANRWDHGCSVALGRARAWEAPSQPVSGQRSCASRAQVWSGLSFSGSTSGLPVSGIPQGRKCLLSLHLPVLAFA